MLTRNHVASIHNLISWNRSKDVEKGIVDIKRRVPETGDSATTGAAHDEGSANIMMLV